MTNLKRERSCLSRTLRKRGQGAREFNACAGIKPRVQVREQVREVKTQRVEDKLRIRTLEAQLKVARADVEVARAEGRTRLATERARPPREVVRTKRVEVPVERVVEVPVERIKEVKVPVEKRVEVPVERKHTDPAVVERELHDLPPAPRERIAHRALEEVDALRASRQRVIEPPLVVVDG